MKNIVIILLIISFLSCSKSENGADSSVDTGSTTNNNNAGQNDNNTPDFGEGSQNEEPEVDPLEDLFEDFQSFMVNRGITGGQLAVTRNEKLIFYRLSGLANVENETQINGSSLFRIASISKPITLLAISKLVADNRLKMSDKVFGTGGILGTTYGTQPYTGAITQITIDHLIEHRSGFTNEPYDIMFDDISLTHADLITRVLDERSLGYSPGGQYYYSNFGYCLLGRVIEEVTGMTYEEYVQQEILLPMGITQMKIGGNTLEEQFENEVTYYSSWFPPYEMNVNRMDSHGGWIASAEDLARFAVYTDTRGTKELLSFGDAQSYMEFGSYIHFGALPGTMTIISVGPTFSYAAVFNSGNSSFELVQNAFVNFMNNEIQNRTNWPSEDLF